MAPTVARIWAGSSRWVRMANGGAPADVMVPITPEMMPASQVLRRVGSTFQPSMVNPTATSSIRP
jgi:hypothetical protein